MKINIRKYILNNFQKSNYNTLCKAIDDSITSQEEVTLPGLGVFFELIWENTPQELKNELIEIIEKSIQKGLKKIEVNPILDTLKKD